LKHFHLFSTIIVSDFLRHWEKLLDLEAQEIFKVNKEIWSMDSAQREKLGRYNVPHYQLKSFQRIISILSEMFENSFQFLF
jgi:hypothetical protein